VDVLVRLDADAHIGSGHAMRCLAIASALTAVGHTCAFAVSSEESAAFLRERGPYDVHVLGGDPLRLGVADARALASLAARLGACAVFLDTYAVTDAFFDGLAADLAGSSRLAYLDDQYTFELGPIDAPTARPVDVLLNYSFYADAAAYEAALGQTGTRLLLGPAYVPLRAEFAQVRPHTAGERVTDVLVTTGSTNPGGTLERMARAVLAEARSGMHVHVVVGAKSTYEGPGAADAPAGVTLEVLHDVANMGELMERCQVAVSAAGTTLYELCAAGVAGLAVAIVPNQQKNMRGYVAGGFGLGCDVDCADDELAKKVSSLLAEDDARAQIVSRCTSVVDASGAARVAVALLDR